MAGILCPYCRRTFSLAGPYRRHIERQHPGCEVFLQQNSSIFRAATVTGEPAFSNETSSFEDQGHWSTGNDNSYSANWQWDTTSSTTSVPLWNSDVESDSGEEEDLIMPYVSSSNAAT